MRSASMIAVALCACGRFGFDPGARAIDAVDAIDATTLRCQTWGAFSAPAKIPGTFHSTTDDWGATPIDSGLELYFYSFRSGNGDLFRTTRATTSDDFGDASLVELSTSEPENALTLTGDALEVLFVGQEGSVFEIYGATRTRADEPFGARFGLPEITEGNDLDPWISADGLRLMFSSDRRTTGGDTDLYETVRTDRTQPFPSPTRVASLSEIGTDDRGPTLSADGLEVFFASRRTGTEYNIFRATRPAVTAEFTSPIKVDEVSSARDDFAPRLSHDGTTLYLSFDTDTGGTLDADLWTATRTCLD